MFMFELFLLILLTAIIVLSIRRKKTAVLDNPIIIHHPGQYHITLAPQLNRAQTFIERIAVQFASSPTPQGDLPSQYFEIYDPQMFAKGEACYLLAIAWRGGILYFQAINPQPLLHDADITNDLTGVVGQPGQMASSSISHLKTLREFSEAVLALHPLMELANAAGTENLRAAVDSVASQSKITVRLLDENG